MTSATAATNLSARLVFVNMDRNHVAQRMMMMRMKCPVAVLQHITELTLRRDPM
jgi:hypothetical protein